MYDFEISYVVLLKCKALPEPSIESVMSFRKMILRFFFTVFYSRYAPTIEIGSIANTNPTHSKYSFVLILNQFCQQYVLNCSLILIFSYFTL